MAILSRTENGMRELDTSAIMAERAPPIKCECGYLIRVSSS